MKSNLVYVMDPLCAWCYTFAGKMEQLMREYPDDLELEIVPWGMFPEPRAVDKNFGNWLENEIRKIQNQTNVHFGERYYSLLHTDSLVLDSRIPARAILAVQSLWPQRTLEFTIDLERMFFFHGRDLSEESLYVDLIDKMGLSSDVFLDEFLLCIDELGFDCSVPECTCDDVIAARRLSYIDSDCNDVEVVLVL